jgi:predicted kinase
MAAAAVQAGTPAVVDATFYHHSMRDLFSRTAQDCRCGIRFILVAASEALTRERLSRPRPDSEADFGVYQSMKHLFEKFEGPHLLLHSKNDNVEEMIEVALKYLG